MKISKINALYEQIRAIPADEMFYKSDIESIIRLSEILPKGVSVFNIGTYFGRSAVLFALTTGWTVLAIDNNEWTQTRFAPYLPEALKDRIKYEIGDSKTYNLTQNYDVVWIDGDHTYEMCKNDIERFADKANIMVCGHDYNRDFPGVIKAVDEIYWDRACIAGNIWYVLK